VILTVGLPVLARPQTGHRPTQRRIDLLAIEQNAWVLAARDPRCVVVSTRTEIDWAMKNGRMIVWAPSKLVLDAVDGPKGSDPVALALWLAEHLAAQALVLHGSVTVPAGSRVPVERG
jgi:dihydroneopterin aldolase